METVTVSGPPISEIISCVCVCVCVCVCEGDRERQRERDRERKREKRQRERQTLRGLRTAKARLAVTSSSLYKYIYIQGVAVNAEKI